MADRRQLTYGGVPVPYTVAWTAEEPQFIGFCPHAQRLALCHQDARGEGKPSFGKPHGNRQRETIALGLCDLCGRPLKDSTKVSLSHARWRDNAAIAPDGTGILQVEPLLHRDCAALCSRHCPSLKRDLRDGSLMVRQVTRYRVQFAVMAPEYVSHYVPDYVLNPSDRFIGHAKVELLGWIDRSAAWLGVADA